MSVRVMDWVFRAAPTSSAFEQLVLLAIADHCADDGAGAYPSLDTLARKTRMSVSSVRRAVQAMVSRGLLDVSKRDGFAHQFTIIVPENPSQTERGSSPRGVPVCNPTPTSLQPLPLSVCEGTPLRLTPDPLDNHQINRQKNRTHTAPAARARDAAFAAFWQRYPRKVAKGAALKAWQKLSPDQATASAILAAVDWQRDRVDWLRDRGRYIPHPASWLHARRWDDEQTEADRRAADLRRQGLTAEEVIARLDPERGDKATRTYAAAERVIARQLAHRQSTGPAIPTAEETMRRLIAEGMPSCAIPAPDAAASRPLVECGDQRIHGTHVVCCIDPNDAQGTPRYRPRLCVPAFLHREFLAELTGPDAETQLLAWYRRVQAQWRGKTVPHDGPKFWRGAFADWQAGEARATGSPAIPSAEETLRRIRAVDEVRP